MVHQVVEGIPLDVKLHIGVVFQELGNLAHIRGANVPFIGSRVDGNPVGAVLDAHSRGPEHRRDVEVSCVPQIGDFVQVDAQSGHWAGAPFSRVESGKMAEFGNLFNRVPPLNRPAFESWNRMKLMEGMEGTQIAPRLDSPWFPCFHFRAIP